MKDCKGKELPCKECGGKCCFYAPIETKVWDRVKKFIPDDAPVIIEKMWENTSKEAFVAMKPDTEGECYFLKEGRCSIYTYRPIACRAVGVKFPCAYVDPNAVKAYIDEIRARGHKFMADRKCLK